MNCIKLKIHATVLPAFVASMMLVGTERAEAQRSTSTGYEVVYANEAADTTTITNWLIEETEAARSGRATHPDVLRIAGKFIGLPYQGGTLEADSLHPGESLHVNTQGMDCTTFVENVLAIALTVDEGRNSWIDYLYNLRKLRYRRGEINGYASRMHYASDWVVDNVAKGLIREITSDLPGIRYGVKTLDFMSRNRELYPALADSATYSAIRAMESGFSNHRYPYLKASTLKAKVLGKELRDGDIVLFTSTKKNLDVRHMGIVTIIDGMPRFIHASSKGGKVMLDPLDIAEYARKNGCEGIRILRLRLNN